MENKDLGEVSVLLRSAAELIYRVDCTDRYLNGISPDDSGEYAQLIETIRTALNCIQNEFNRTFQRLHSSINGKNGTFNEGIQIFHLFLAKYCRWFNAIHSLLVYLPKSHIALETSTSLLLTFEDHYRNKKPSIILGGLVNALEYDFFQKVKSYLPDIEEIKIGDKENIVLELAICDRDSPPTWAVLAHEMGHAIDSSEGISKRVTDTYVKDPNSAPYQIVHSWAKEICSDLIAASVLGPSAILSIISLQYCFFSNPSGCIYSPSKSHPATTWRMDVISSFLQKKYSFDFLRAERRFLILTAEYDLKQKFKKLKVRNKIKREVKSNFEFIFKPLATAVEQEVIKLNLGSHELNRESLERCQNRLSNGLIISAQGKSREKLRDELIMYKNNRNTTKDENIKNKFRELTDKFKEEPLDLTTILMSCFNNRIQFINMAINNDDVFSEPEIFATLCENLKKLDELTSSSINRNWVHRNI